MSLPASFVLPLDKPEGPTSHDMVAAVRRALGQRRVGHTGTLDPFASGLLLACVGKATRLAEYLSGLDKSYDAVARLGEVTDTLDREGAVVETHRGWEGLDAPAVEAALGSLRGRLEQVPPAYSAKKIRGKAAHRLARQGEAVELAPAAVTVHAIELASLDLPLVGFRVRCSSGTYVRALARDLGAMLGVGAHLVRLRRTSIGGFGLAGALTPDRLDDEAAVAAASIEPLEALRHLPTLVADDDEAGLLSQGRPLQRFDEGLDGLVAVAHAGALLAVAESSGGVLRPRKVFGS